jgi:hypothetical protein
MAVKKQEKKNLGGAPIGNKNAYVDDEKEVIEKLNGVINGFLDDSYKSLADAYLLNGLSYFDITYYSEKYSQNVVVSKLIKKVKNIGAIMLEKNGLNGAVNSPMAMFLLKHHYGYSDQPKQDNSTKKIVIKVTGKKDV